MKYSKVMNLLIVVIVVVLGIVGDCYGDLSELQDGYYRESCCQAEEIVRNVTWQYVGANPAMAAKLLRLHFHDCFVRGAEASILLNSTANNTAEKDAFPNLSLGGFYIIDAIKTALEAACPGIVSCADIVALAARDAVSYQFNYSLWEVQTGRKDGNVSLASEVLAELPSPAMNFTQLQQSFANKSLSVRDLVVLSGGHAIGVAQCVFFGNRVYNFDGNGNPDPTLNPNYVAYLKTICKGEFDFTTEVPMVPGSGLIFNNTYYTNLENNEGIFTSDAALLTDNYAKSIVNEMGRTWAFFYDFGQSMRRMGTVGVLTGNQGVIRKQCALNNS
ncbi:hypothetical protein Vadar_003115 [Vaccinium darrowii]|uniref:Uncharacterized protein n=1 Tax=Vaccinium darrowii TaxID=229202 RepID=A0ACB7XN60_9ERIC|nr:hypothetical protein Vadar_003115 [Vaccinium darrowii]